MKTTILLAILLVLFIAITTSCMTLKDAKFVMHEGILQSYCINCGDDKAVFTDNTTYCTTAIWIWDGYEPIRNICVAKIGDKYKIYYVSHNTYLLVSSDIIPSQTNCGCK